MKFRRLFLVGLCVASLGSVSIPGTASAEVGIFFNVAPPPARHETVPPPRRGYVWSTGYWNVNHNKHVWQAGRWERERAGYHFTQPTWTQHDNRWQLDRGRWEK